MFYWHCESEIVTMAQCGTASVAQICPRGPICWVPPPLHLLQFTPRKMTIEKQQYTNTGALCDVINCNISRANLPKIACLCKTACSSKLVNPTCQYLLMDIAIHEISVILQLNKQVLTEYIAFQYKSQIGFRKVTKDFFLIMMRES